MHCFDCVTADVFSGLYMYVYRVCVYVCVCVCVMKRIISMFETWQAFYSTIAFWNEGVMSSVEPWSGHYVASPTLWATAHTTQFTRAGKMHYLLQGSGSGALDGGGSYVSFVDPDTHDLTIVIEAAGPAIGPFGDGNCNGRTMYTAAQSSQTATFKISNLQGGSNASDDEEGGAGGAAGRASALQSIALWRTQLGTNASSSTDADKGYFQQMKDLPVVDGVVSLVVQPDAIYTLSTLRTATKAGGTPPTIPPSQPFPLPYSDNFDTSIPPAQGKYWSDQDGAFEVAAETPSSANHVLLQAAVAKACCNFIPSLDGPVAITVIGSSTWQNVVAEVAINVGATPGSFGALGIRATFVPGSFFRGGT